MPVILAPWEADIGRFLLLDQSEQKSFWDSILTNKKLGMVA
jgi:hypothetical protein